MATTRAGGGWILGVGAAALVLLLIAVIALRPGGSKQGESPAPMPTSSLAEKPQDLVSTSKPQQPSTPELASAEVASSPAPAAESPTTAPAVADGSSSPKQHLTSPIRLLATIEGKGEPIAGVRLSGPITADALDSWRTGKMENIPVVGTTGADGRAEITSVAPMGRKYGWSWSLFAEAPGYQSALVSIPMHQSTSGTASGDPVDVFLELRPAGMATLEGRVVDEQNAPIEGAVVQVGAANKGFSHRSSSDVPEDLKVEVASTSRPVRTDQEGRFTITEAPDKQEFIHLIASAKGFATTGYTTVLNDTSSLTVVLQRADAELFVRVESPDGEVLPGATVSVARTGYSAAATTLEAITDARGEVLIGGLPAGDVAVFASHPLHPLQFPENGLQSVYLTKGKRSELAIQIPRSVVVTGKVFEESSGKGVGGAKIYAEPPEGGLLTAPSATSDSTGAFRLEGVAMQENDLRLYIRPPSGFEAEDSSIWIEVENHLQIPPVEISLFRTATQYGVVLAEDEITPVADAELWMSGPVSTWRRTQRSDANGRFLIEVIPGTELTIHGSHPDHGKGTLSYEGASEPVSVPETVSLILRENASISGRLVTAAGQPLKNLPVSLMTNVVSGISMTTSMLSTSSDESGHYTINHVSAGKLTVRLQFDYNSMGSDEARTDVFNLYKEPKEVELDLKPGENRTGVDFVFEEAFSITGTVKDEAGNPVTNTRLGFNSRLGASTDEKGGFRLRVDVQPGELIPPLTVRPPAESGLGVTTINGLTLSTTPLEIVLKKRSVPTLRVTYEDGRPVTRYRYRTLHFGYDPVLVESPDGTTTPLGAMPYEAVELREDGRPGLAGFTKWESGIEGLIVLRPRATIHGRVELASSSETGAAVVGATVALHGLKFHGAFDPKPVVTDAQGNFQMEGVIARPNNIKATKEGLASPDEDGEAVHPKPGENHGPVVLKLAANATVRGTITGPDGKPAVGATVSTSTKVGSEASTITDTFGRYELASRCLGSQYLEIHIERGMPAWVEEIECPGGGIVEKHIDLTGAVILSGRFLCNGNAGEGTTEFSLRSADSDPNTRRDPYLYPNRDGLYERFLLPGKYHLEAQNDDYRLSGGTTTLVETFTVPPSPFRQTRDFNFCLASATIVIVFPTDQDFAPGDLRLAIPGSAPSGSKMRLQQPSMIIPGMLPVAYEATFRTADGQWEGKSDVVQLKHGAENLMVITCQRTTPSE